MNGDVSILLHFVGDSSRLAFEIAALVIKIQFEVTDGVLNLFQRVVVETLPQCRQGHPDDSDR